MNQASVDCPFCNTQLSISKVVGQYKHWNLFLHADKKRADTKLAAGFLASKRHFDRPVNASGEEWQELLTIFTNASRQLCQVVGATYLGQETIGFNQGELAGQTVDHAHIHVFPVAEEDLSELKGRAGMNATS